MLRTEAAEFDAQSLLHEGIPLTLTGRRAKQYTERCRVVVDALGGNEPLTALKLRAAEAVVATQAGLDGSAGLAGNVWESARRIGGDTARAYGLVAWCIVRQDPDHAVDRARAATEILEIAEAAGESALVPIGQLLLLVALLEQGEIRSLDRKLAQLKGEDTGAPADWFSCLRSILDGDATQAEAEADVAYAHADTEGTEAAALHTTQIGMIRWMQGRVDGIEDGFLAARRAYPQHLLWPASLAWLWLQQGRREAAEALLRTLPEVQEIPRDRYWLSTMVVLAEIATISGTRARAVQLQRLLAPFAERLVAVGVGVAFWGTVARTLGLLEERLGMFEAARRHLELAIETSGRIGALAWQAEAQIELAEFAFRHELADVPAYELLAEARATSEARGFAGLARRAMHRPRIRVLGYFETISLCGRRAEWNSRKARDLFKMLIAARGEATSREVFMDELWPGIAPAKLTNRFSVAVNTIRRALDPDRLLPTQHHLVTEGDALRLRLEHLDIDLERFFDLGSRLGEGSARAALDLYRGDAFSDEPYADWAADVRDRARRVRDALEWEAQEQMPPAI